jgi:hypothetical protein
MIPKIKKIRENPRKKANRSYIKLKLTGVEQISGPVFICAKNRQIQIN